MSEKEIKYPYVVVCADPREVKENIDDYKIELYDPEMSIVPLEIVLSFTKIGEKDGRDILKWFPE